MRKTLVALAAAAVFGFGGVAVAQDRGPGAGPVPHDHAGMPHDPAAMPHDAAGMDAMHARMSPQMPAEMRERCDTMHARMNDGEMGTTMGQMTMKGGGMGAMTGGAR